MLEKKTCSEKKNCTREPLLHRKNRAQKFDCSGKISLKIFVTLRGSLVQEGTLLPGRLLDSASPSCRASSGSRRKGAAIARPARSPPSRYFEAP